MTVMMMAEGQGDMPVKSAEMPRDENPRVSLGGG